MEKVYCSLEDWDSILDFYRPNGASKSWYLEEEGKLDFPKMWGLWNLLDLENSFKLHPKQTLYSQIKPYFNSNVEFVDKSSKGDKKHIYLINIFDPNFFERNKNIGFKCISQEYVQDVRNGKCDIVMALGLEGYSGSLYNNDLEIINSWIEEMNLPPEKIHFVSGNLLIDKICKEKNFNFNCIPISYFDSWINYLELPQDIISFIPNGDEKYLFLSYNRNPREHRLFLLSQLIERNFFNKGLISLDEFKIYDIDNTPESLKILNDLTPIIIDRPLNINWANNITPNDFECTFISLVTESLVLDNCLFLSEKIWKPISLGHPFLIYGNYKTLEYIKSLGFKTFDKWIDESYDNEKDINKRGLMIVNELEKFKDKTIEELKSLREEMSEICIYNQSLFKKLVREKYSYNNDENIDVFKPIIDIFFKISNLETPKQRNIELI